MARPLSRLGLFSFFASLLGTALSGACAPLLGIDEAVCDPEEFPTCEADESPVVAQGSNGPQQGGSANMPMGMGGSGEGGSGMAGGNPNSGGSGMGGSGMASGGSEMPGAGGSDLGAEGGGGNPGSCENYCTRIQALCTEDNGLQQYGTFATCVAYCETFPVGDLEAAEAPRDNSLACRLDQLRLAETIGMELEIYCSAAGPGGYGAETATCGSACAGYCGAMLEACPEVYPTSGACVADCQGIADLAIPEDDEPPILYVQSNIDLQNGDHVQCRLYHVSASFFDPGTHCPHAAGDALCVVPDP